MIPSADGLVEHKHEGRDSVSHRRPAVVLLPVVDRPSTSPALIIETGRCPRVGITRRREPAT
jgi:hypothetical protein